MVVVPMAMPVVVVMLVSICVVVCHSTKVTRGGQFKCISYCIVVAEKYGCPIKSPVQKFAGAIFLM